MGSRSPSSIQHTGGWATKARATDRTAAPQGVGLHCNRSRISNKPSCSTAPDGLDTCRPPNQIQRGAVRLYSQGLVGAHTALPLLSDAERLPQAFLAYSQVGR